MSLPWPTFSRLKNKWLLANHKHQESLQCKPLSCKIKILTLLLIYHLRLQNNTLWIHEALLNFMGFCSKQSQYKALQLYKQPLVMLYININPLDYVITSPFTTWVLDHRANLVDINAKYLWCWGVLFPW